VNWYEISTHQTLSEEFIKEFQDKVNWYQISSYQTLSEEFIREFQDKVDWYEISIHQTLSEEFIREFQDKVNWYEISKYQRLSKKFIKGFKLSVPDSSWLYKTQKEKLKLAKKAGYKIKGKSVIAYKAVRKNMASVYKPGMVYKVGKCYTAHCNCLGDDDNSFGLSAWTKEKALEYYNRGKLLEVEIPIKDLGVIVHNGGKIRCFGLKVLRVV